MDNIGARKPHFILGRIRQTGASVLFLPPYSPGLNPIENCWSKLKAILKDLGARALEALDKAIAQTMDLITPADAAAWLQHCGHAIQPNWSPLSFTLTILLRLTLEQSH